MVGQGRMRTLPYLLLLTTFLFLTSIPNKAQARSPPLVILEAEEEGKEVEEEVGKGGGGGGGGGGVGGGGAFEGGT
ncbi:hypothetical protein Pmani_022929 [Petrolisthes manimaculis]|uniref:Uncharacterized protein n=1 Tax=Petrolisthes manimaculis TaxID=1843537 RepID=A0AAE1PBU2_9EUCA|nr:hypothetical protein Pmani_022929 [Petrolisthes manimaculis]